MAPSRFPNEPVQSYIARINAESSAIEAAIRAQDRDRREISERGRDVAMSWEEPDLDQGLMGIERERGGIGGGGRVEPDRRDTYEGRQRMEHQQQQSHNHSGWHWQRCRSIFFLLLGRLLIFAAILYILYVYFFHSQPHQVHSSQQSDSEKINITSTSSLNIQIPLGANGTIEAIKGVSLVRRVEMEVRDADGKSGAGQESVETEEYKHEYNFEGEEWWGQRWREGVV